VESRGQDATGNDAERVRSNRFWNRRESLRRQALDELGVSRFERSWAHRRLLVRGAAAGGLIIGIGVFTFVPRWQITFGPFGSEDDAQQYLQTLWQVVAAAVGVSVALIAFVFEAFVSSGERRHGGTLREFARQTHILLLFDMAAISLVLDGLALAGLGERAPAGWSGFVAAVASGLTLLVLLVMVPRVILRSLDPEQLTEMRLRATRALARRAVREQLIGQIALNELYTRRESGLSQGLLGLSRGTQIETRRSGVLHDIRRGNLLRALRGLELGAERHAEVVVELERTVDRGTTLIVIPGPVGGLRRWRVRRAFRIRRGSEQIASVGLERALDRLAQQILGAVRRGDETEWRMLDELLRDVLLELPLAVSKLGLTFDGAVSRPGWLRRGPAQRVFEILDRSFEQALQEDSRYLAEGILYSPYHAAVRALKLSAPGLLQDAARFYPLAYNRVRQREADRLSPGSQSLTADVIEVLFQLADRVGAHALAFGNADDIPAGDAQANLERVLASVITLLRAAIEERDETAVNDVLRRLSSMTGYWDGFWRDDERGVAQRELLAILGTLRFAVASWALHLLARASDRDDWSMWQRITAHLLSGLRKEEMANAYWRLADRGADLLGIDYRFWFYDNSVGRVQTLDYASKAAQTLVVGLALLAESGDQIAFAIDPGEGWRVQELVAAVDRVAADTERYAPVFGAPVTAVTTEDGANGKHELPSLQRVRNAFEEAGAEASRQAAERTRAAMLDPERVAEFRTLVAKAAEEERVVKPLLKAAGSWRIVDSPQWEDRVEQAWSTKAAYTGEPSHVGQGMVATQMGRRAGRHELGDLVALCERLPAKPLGDDVAGELGRAVEQATHAAAVPPIVVCPINPRLFEVLGVGFRGEADALIAADVLPEHAARFNGVFHGAPVIDHPSLRDRVLIISLAALRMEERPTPGQVGVIPQVLSFDHTAAAARVESEVDVFASMPEAERVPWVMGQVLLEVAIAWKLLLDDPEGVKVFSVPPKLARK